MPRNFKQMLNKKRKLQHSSKRKSETSSITSSNDEEEMSYDVLLQNSQMISLLCKKYKEKVKAFICENIELKKSNEVLKKKIQTLEENLS